ncbi:MAG TPA: Fis family transcriptional regulator [Thioalkalivibrio sp.]|nr:Fis family transcriptional regulator [Thioalkalivibrio sp.]
MIEESARVVRLEDGYAWVETQRKSACGQCSASKGCGTSVLDKVLGRRRSVVRVLNPVGAELGDEVVIGLGEGAFVRGSLAVYALPLVTLLAGAMLGQWLGQADVAAVLGGLAGLAAGFAWVWLFTRRIAGDSRYQPVILRRVPTLAPRAHGVFSP